jgi:GT2 family glycosyltransferase
MPRCSIVIPHLVDPRPLLATLHALARSAIELEIVLVDNASTDGSVEAAADLFPGITVVRSDVNLGYAGGANLGLVHARAPWCIFLNDDAVPAPGAIEAIVDELETSPVDDLPLLQPVLRSSGDPRRFDYAGGAGGLIDRWGYTFALGRLFETVEIDDGQYAAAGPLAWASGCCLAGPTERFRELGGFEERFFAHFEEIDLCWRHRLAGGVIRSVPGAIVYHMGPSTLPAGTRKTFLNFRNNLWTVRRNYCGRRLLHTMFIRSVLDPLAAFRWLMLGRPRLAAATVRGIAAGLFTRSGASRSRYGGDRGGRGEWGTYTGSIVVAGFLKRITAARLLAGRIAGWETNELVETGS